VRCAAFPKPQTYDINVLLLLWLGYTEIFSLRTYVFSKCFFAVSVTSLAFVVIYCRHKSVDIDFGRNVCMNLNIYSFLQINPCYFRRFRIDVM
jgi:hypothetical protein